MLENQPLNSALKYLIIYDIIQDIILDLTYLIFLHLIFFLDNKDIAVYFYSHQCIYLVLI